MENLEAWILAHNTKNIFLFTTWSCGGKGTESSRTKNPMRVGAKQVAGEDTGDVGDDDDDGDVGDDGVGDVCDGGDDVV